MCPIVSVNKNVLLNYGYILWLWVSRLKWNRICPKGKSGRRILWQQQLPFNDCLLFTRCCAGTFDYINTEHPQSFLRRPALALWQPVRRCPSHDPRIQGWAPPQPGYTHTKLGYKMVTVLPGFISQSECSSERLSICPRLCYWQKAASGFKYSSLTPSLTPAFPFQVLLALRKQLSSLLAGLIGFSFFDMGTSFLASEAAISLVSGDLGKKVLSTIPSFPA